MLRRARIGRLALAASLVVLLGSGCTPEPDPKPTPTPAPVTPTPTESDQEREQRLAYEAAEKSYRDFRVEVNRVLRAGGAKTATPVMKRTAAGTYLEAFSNAVQSYQELGSRDRGNESVVFVRRGGYSPREVVLNVCEDSRTVATINKRGEQVGVGELRTATIQVRQISGSWKLWSGVGKKVSSCE